MKRNGETTLKKRTTMKDECQWSEMERKLQIRGALNMQKQGITNILALPINKMLYCD
jgi:hypothetical protein